MAALPESVQIARAFPCSHVMQYDLRCCSMGGRNEDIRTWLLLAHKVWVCATQEADELHHPLLGEEPTLHLLPDPVDVPGAAPSVSHYGHANHGSGGVIPTALRMHATRNTASCWH